MRFDKDGEPIGGIRTLKSLGLPANEVEKNWEGLSWYGKDHLILISDNGGGHEGKTRIFKATLPKGW